MVEYRIEVKWNRTDHWSYYVTTRAATAEKAKESAIKVAEDALNSGDGARVKGARIMDKDDNIIWRK